MFGSARLQLLEPSSSVRLPSGQVPYCLGSSSSAPLSGYSYPTSTTYAWNSAPSTGSPQGTCLYLDAILAISDVFQPGGSMVPTRTSLTPQTVYPLPTCATLASPACVWNATTGLP